MHCGKQARRGYNQAQELAVLLGEELGWPYAGVLKRLPDTLPQASLSREQRLRHARKIYAADEKRMKRSPVRGRDVLLVDDVLRPEPRQTPAPVCSSAPGLLPSAC